MGISTLLPPVSHCTAGPNTSFNLYRFLADNRSCLTGLAAEKHYGKSCRAAEPTTPNYPPSNDENSPAKGKNMKVTSQVDKH